MVQHSVDATVQSRFAVVETLRVSFKHEMPLGSAVRLTTVVSAVAPALLVHWAVAKRLF
jgi:hypothetical protein